MSALSASFFINEDTSPIVESIPSGPSPLVVIRFGQPSALLTLFTQGGPQEALDYWDRLRRACIEAIDLTQRGIYEANHSLGIASAPATPNDPVELRSIKPEFGN